MTKRSLICAVVLGVLMVGAAFAADAFEDKDLGISVAPPSGFTKSGDTPSVPDAIGTVKGYYVSPQAKENAAKLMIHAMPLPDGASYDQFKTDLSNTLQNYFQSGYKLVKQEDVSVKGLTGFVLEAEVPGDETDLKPGGDQKHHLRWYLFKRGDNGLTGVAYTARESAWKDLEPKFTASFKSLKHPE